MKTSCLAVVISILLSTFTSVSAADLKDGFFEYSWGESINHFPEFNYLYSKDGISYYSDPGRSYTIKNLEVNDLVFGFYEEQLFAVYIGINSLDVYDNIDQYLKSKYGWPETKVSSKDPLTVYKWKYKGVVLKLKTDQLGAKMKLAFYYPSLVQDLRKEQLEQAQNTSFKFFPIDKNKKPEHIPFLEF